MISPINCHLGSRGLPAIFQRAKGTVRSHKPKASWEMNSLFRQFSERFHFETYIIYFLFNISIAVFRTSKFSIVNNILNTCVSQN